MISYAVKSSGWPSQEDLEDLAEDGVKELAGRIFRAAVRFSPVYTGAFRASWRVSFGEARTDVTAGYAPEAPIRGAYFRWPRGFKLGMDVVISNNQPYAEFLEDGGSSQAPGGVLRVAVASVQVP